MQYTVHQNYTEIFFFKNRTLKKSKITKILEGSPEYKFDAFNFLTYLLQRKMIYLQKLKPY